MRAHYNITASLEGEALETYILLSDIISEARNAAQVKVAAAELDKPEIAALLGEDAVQELRRQIGAAMPVHRN